LTIASGTKLGRYEIRSKVGAGGMGEVYLAQDTKLDRKVALKILPAEVADDKKRMQRFVQEAKAASALNHPNIITIHEIDEANSIHFIATEFIDGETLRQRSARTRLTVAESLGVAIQVASGLAAAHEAGILHRDIKPDNIMVRRDGLLKILDFGLAKLTAPEAVDPESPTRKLIETDPGVVMGTLIYMSPEQARGLTVDARTDIFSLGVLLYEMVAGCLPFEGATTSEILAAILNEKEPPPLARFAREVPAELERIVEKALRKDREERYQGAKDMLLDLKRLKQRLEVEAEIERTVPPELRGATGEARPSGGQEAVSTAQASAAQTVTVESARPTSSAEYIISEIKRRKRGVAATLAAFTLLSVAGIAYYFYSGRGGGGAGTIRSIAVLPFTNADGNPDAEYLSDGISESLINSLSQLPGVKVIARSSSFKYKGKEVDPQEVARSLSVEAILTGRVTQRGENLLISVELMNARDKTQVWGAQYNRSATDVLQVQSEISREIAEKLRLHLTAGEQQQLAKRETVNPQAYELLLRGRLYERKATTENRKKAIEYYQQAIAVDPAYALAYAELSASYGDLVNSNLVDPKEFTPKAEMAARRALELDESLAEAHLAMAGIKIDAWDWAVGERELKRAIELNPNLARAHSEYASYLNIQGRREQAVAETKRARELDPLSPGTNQAVVFGLLFAGQNDQAIEAAKKMLELDQGNPDLHWLLGRAYEANQQYAEAVAAHLEAIKLGDNSPDAQIFLGGAYAKVGEGEKARAILKRLETGKEYVSPVGLATLRAALGDREQAFALLERAYAAHDQQMIWLGSGWEFDPLRPDPRFKDLMRRVGLPQ
jgi:eukaryotic-like serine/threonine-protein kinase